MLITFLYRDCLKRHLLPPWLITSNDLRCWREINVFMWFIKVHKWKRKNVGGKKRTDEILKIIKQSWVTYVYWWHPAVAKVSEWKNSYNMVKHLCWQAQRNRPWAFITEDLLGLGGGATCLGVTPGLEVLSAKSRKNFRGKDRVSLSAVSVLKFARLRCYPDKRSPPLLSVALWQPVAHREELHTCRCHHPAVRKGW